MQNRRKTFLRGKITFAFLNTALVIVIVLGIVDVITSIFLIVTEKLSLTWNLAFVIFQFAFVGVSLAFLITLMFLLHRGFGALSRITNIMDRVIEGDYSLRVHIRQEDLLREFTGKVNTVLDVLEKKAHP